ncbi:tRNA-uridine aminocarboxypropyltransferase [uncultured Shewanella sp.]|uniref:DTW domain-containing protein n=1 Tax=uncultured Shewanella sp. TaxID=173975 RepID=UPI0026045584|nr:tRNA-uridine aminocarboxypropyltransferase [uncultured Shewanella sp.]
MNVILLTHEREVERPTNTGSVALKAYPQWCRRIIWSRVSPDETVLELLQQSSTAVLYPAVTCQSGVSEDANSNETIVSGSYLTELPETLIIIDATWQEARKMIRQSPYLQQANKFALPDLQSRFKLRRNQVEGGLCTLECIISLCLLNERYAEAENLEQLFLSVNQAR